MATEKSNKKSTRGGKRPGAGRPVGSQDPQTIERERVLEAMKTRIAKTADKLLNSQMNLAQGVQMLYCITANEKGIRSKPELITSQTTIESYLAGELEDDDKEYYFITTERPDNRALDSLFDRTFGKSKESLDVTTNGESINEISYEQAKSIIAREGSNPSDSTERVDSV